jgi:hypothetical protein
MHASPRGGNVTEGDQEEHADDRGTDDERRLRVESRARARGNTSRPV